MPQCWGEPGTLVYKSHPGVWSYGIQPSTKQVIEVGLTGAGLVPVVVWTGLESVENGLAFEDVRSQFRAGTMVLRGTGVARGSVRSKGQNLQL